MSKAIAEQAGPGPVAAGVIETPGFGLEARIDGRKCRLGSADWTGAPAADEAGLSLWFSCEGQAPARFCFEDQLAPGASKAMETLRKQGFEIEIVSGDRAQAVAQIGSQLGVSAVMAHASPQDKVRRLELLRTAGRRVLMVGDGLNDAAALALADAAIAPGGAMDVSQSASDAVYARGLASIPELIDVARVSRRIMLQNFWFAGLYNLVAIPIALTGHATPFVAAIAMSTSSIIVSLNALRLTASGRGRS